VIESYGARLGRIAAAHPDAVALVVADVDGRERRVTWGELETASCAFGHRLRDGGVGSGSLVMVALKNCAEHFFASIGALKAGATIMPLRGDVPAWESSRYVATAKPTVIVSEWGDRHRGDAICLSSRDVAEAVDRPGAAAPLPDAVAQPWRIMPSGGSTGMPKLIADPRPGQTDEGPVFAQPMHPGQRPGGVQLVPTQMYHGNGLMLSLMGLMDDQCLVVMEKFDADRAVGLIERYRVTTATMAPTMLLRILRLPDIGGRDLTSLVSVLQGAAACPASVVRGWIELIGGERFFMCYGSGEGVGVTVITGTEWLDHPGSVGRGYFTDIRVLDDEGADVEPGTIGNVHLRVAGTTGPSFHYIGPETMAVTRDGFTCIGDVGWMTEDGYLYIADRRLDMVVSGGANVYPAEVEAALIEHADVADVAVVGLPDPEWGARVHAIVEVRAGAARLDEASVRAHCRARLAAYKVPKTVEFVAQLPRTETGKLNRSALVAERVAAR